MSDRPVTGPQLEGGAAPRPDLDRLITVAAGGTGVIPAVRSLTLHGGFGRVQRTYGPWFALATAFASRRSPVRSRLAPLVKSLQTLRFSIVTRVCHASECSLALFPTSLLPSQLDS